MQPLSKLPPRRPVTGKQYNMLVDKLNSMQIKSTSNMRRVQTPGGVHLIGQNPSVRTPKIWRIVQTNQSLVTGMYSCREAFPSGRSLQFTSGGTTEPAVGDVLEGTVGGATATLISTDIWKSAFSTGLAAGSFSIKDQTGTFEAENLDIVGGDSNVATISADSFLFTDDGDNFVAKTISADDMVDVYNVAEAGNKQGSGMLSTGEYLHGYEITDSEGTTQRLAATASFTSLQIARVKSDQTGMNGPFYKCDIYTLDLGQWNTTNDPISIGYPDVEVLHMGELNLRSGTRQLTTNDYLSTWPVRPATSSFLPDVNGTSRWVGIRTGFDTETVQTISGSRGANAALADLLTTMDTLRLIRDTTT
jgi:hypothetical protein